MKEITVEITKKLRDGLTVGKLMSTEADVHNNWTTLEFYDGCVSIFVRAHGADDKDDVFYWDYEENVRAAVNAADDEDFRVMIDLETSRRHERPTLVALTDIDSEDE